MTRVKKIGNAYYLTKRTGWKNIFYVRAGEWKGGYISVSGIIRIPAEFVGKKVRFRMEVIEDE